MLLEWFDAWCPGQLVEGSLVRAWYMPSITSFTIYFSGRAAGEHVFIHEKSILEHVDRDYNLEYEVL